MNPPPQSSLDPVKSPAAFWQLARTLAAYSARAYTEPSVTDSATRASALIVAAPRENTTDVSAAFSREAAIDIVVAFKGSSTPRDFLADASCWLSDLNWNRTNWPQGHGIKVHHGFLFDASSILPPVIEQVAAAIGAPASRTGPAPGTGAPRIFLTGHSLGGALAELAALEFTLQNIPIAGVITFGGPRVGNGAFAAAYDAAQIAQEHTEGTESEIKPGAKISEPVVSSTLPPVKKVLKEITFRVVNQNDIVPRTPGWLLGYRHCGQEIFLEPLPAAGWNVNPSSAHKLFRDALGLYGACCRRQDVLIRDHFIAAYQDRITNL